MAVHGAATSEVMAGLVVSVAGVGEHDAMQGTAVVVVMVTDAAVVVAAAGAAVVVTPGRSVPEA